MPYRLRSSRIVEYARLIVILGCAALLAMAAYDSARRGLADWRSMHWRAEIRQWARGRPIESRAQWQRAVDALRAQLRASPYDAEIWNSLGLAYNVGSWKFAHGALRNIYVGFALIYYRRAAALIPTWPYAWIGVALMKYRLGQFDAEFGRAFSAAMRLGPWEPDVQIAASDIGLALWDRLDARFKKQVRETWRRTAVWQPDKLAKLAISHKRVGLMCNLSLDALKNRLKCPR